MHPKLLELLHNVENRIEQVRKGPLPEKEFQLFVLTTLATMLQEVGEG